MKSSHILLTVLLAGTLLLCGCSKDDENGGSDVISDTESSGNADESSDATSSEPSESSPESVVPVPVEYSVEDKALQTLLLDMQKPVEEIMHWYSGMVPPPPELEFVFPQLGSDAVTHYVFIPDNYRAQEDASAFVMPVNRSGMRSIMLEYFSEECTDRFISSIRTGSAVKAADGSYVVTLNEEPGQSFGSLYPTFLELNGRLYRFNALKPVTMNIDCGSAKIIEKTADTIKFSYLHYSSIYDFDKKYQYEPCYSENALTGTLKFERGGWRLDSWES